ncbi:CaiB/BaiF CoA transferase family protein [Microbulbifer hydrolyticus]|uniref:CoA transferase n=1 Tax=Microbulbifer hydrolyticus TaxID=48074 RepID=A0A6P1TCE8_9GAMM|nr:CoA transferase [Microbulbifer hydrolyticus]MBB5210181.1 crotonobetainyl-CoA:carnitine CoA-transferase CaiB-like acyl-CoA transferase [Microbulbifer hydrolyticus]QHQ39306.1 CoA transferase [Microbulbifer hydrolyticus]
MHNKPLAGIRVIAVEQYGAGPFGSMQLADMGAEVIKIENPATGGDVARQSGPYFLGDNDSDFFQTFNRSKKSLTLDLKSPEGRKIFERLVQSADIVMNNLRGDQPAKLGLDYDSLGGVKREIICGHLSAYGRDNDRAGWPGYDYLMQAEMGFMDLTGEPGSPPARFGLSMVDFMSGVTLAMAVLGVLVGVLRGGTGRDVDVSLFDVAATQLTYPATWYLNRGHETGRVPRSGHPSTVPCQIYRSADGWVFVMAMTEKFWQVLVEGLGRPDLLADVRFATVAARRQYRETLTEILDTEFSSQPNAHWMAVFAGRLPLAPVNTFAQAMDNPWLAQTGLLQSLPHVDNSQFRLLASPLKFDGNRPTGTGCSALGADSEELLLGLGYSAEDIAAWRSGQVI